MGISCDVLIVGGGLAGLFAAAVADEHLKVVLLCKTENDGSCSYLAQGGIAAAADAVDREVHIADTLRAGAGQCDEHAVRVLVENAWDNIMLLEKMGVCFDRKLDGLSRTLEGGHTVPRILHIGGDATGKGLVEVLYPFVCKRANVQIISNAFCRELLVEDGQCRGAVFSDGTKLDVCEAKAVLLATGGVGQVYGDTTNPPGATADGIGLAYRAGAEIAGLEFIQFHPTVFHPIKGGRRFLVSEAMRGEGGKLINSLGERFMEKYDARLELAPRDIVARAVVHEIRRTGNPCVYLDVRHLDEDFIAARFPTIKEKCAQAGISIPSDKIPVSCAQHYCMGGVKTDTKGRTCINALYACGEVANTGVHGANRLASNSLLEALVFSRRSMNDATEQLARQESQHAEYINRSNINEIGAESNCSERSDESYSTEIAAVQTIMMRYFSVERTSAGMAAGLNGLQEIMDRIKNDTAVCSVRLRPWECLNIVQTALLIAMQAIARTKSVGSHYLIGEGE